MIKQTQSQITDTSSANFLRVREIGRPPDNGLGLVLSIRYTGLGFQLSIGVGFQLSLDILD